MPYELFRKGSQHCVRKKGGGRTMGCHKTRGEATAQLRALYAAEGRQRKKEMNGQIVMDIMGEGDAVSDEVYEAVRKAVEEYDRTHGSGIETDADVEVEEKNLYMEDSYSPLYGATSFAELDEVREAQEREMEVAEIASQFTMLAQNILHRPEIDDKPAAISALSDEFGKRVGTASKELARKELEEESLSRKEDTEPNFTRRVTEAITNALKSVFGEKDRTSIRPQEDLMIWKEADGRYRWLTRYSNNFRDDDNPPEIISKKSHERFVDLVDKGQVPMPELWLWHVPDWKIGDATWITYDTSGFALAAGFIDKGKEDIAELLMNQKDVLVSHGMPTSTIKRDENDQSIIIEHETREISVLPAWAAANKMTGFVLLSKEVDMAIPAKKKASLIEDWGVKAELLERLEEQNATVATEATDKGIENKEATETEATVSVAEETAETLETPSAETTTETVADDKKEETPAVQSTAQTSTEFPTRVEVAEAVAGIIVPLMDKVDAIASQLADFALANEAKQKSREEEVAELVANTPAASLGALLAQRVSKSKETAIDGRTTLAKSAPKETEPEIERHTGIPFLDKMISEKSAPNG